MTIDVAWKTLKEFRRKVVGADATLKPAYTDKMLFNTLVLKLPPLFTPTLNGIKAASRIGKEFLPEEKIATLAEDKAEDTRQQQLRQEKRRSRSREADEGILFLNTMDDNTVRYQKAIPILTRDNQDAWFRQVKLRLEAKNIFYVVEHDIVDVVGVRPTE
ncbi:hypothetical protein E4U56_004731 [Claviceps arundinis]|uniref:Uncharacterized protein n=1 Tax=Claviceps arundinis TaxID=1623583 RepID=A0A9P7SRG8_9HYPO|nr:hypothetical protein E4U56_004731 [Claviceps arundinis]